MSYGTWTGVAARAPALRLGSAQSPEEAQVEQWLAEGAAWIDRTLGAAGYVTPVVPPSALYTELVALGEQYAAAQAIRARGLDSLTGAGEERSTILLREVRERLAEMMGQDLTALGASSTATGARPLRRLRSVQMRRIDGYSGASEMRAGEWDGLTPPSD